MARACGSVGRLGGNFRLCSRRVGGSRRVFERRHGGLWSGARTVSGAEKRGGKAPKGYTRSDERLKEMICERLMQDPSLDASEVEIQVVSGRVTLEGSVDSRMEKYQIEDVVEATGVADVQNNLRISRSGESWQSQSSERGSQSGSSLGMSGSGSGSTSGQSSSGSSSSGTSGSSKESGSTRRSQ